MNAIREVKAWSLNGLIVVPVALIGLILGSIAVGHSIQLDRIVHPALLILGSGVLALASLLVLGFFVVQPNQAQVLVLLGRYTGSVCEPGFYWTLPFVMQQRSVSLRVRNFNSDRLKVNDAQGSPIEIAAVIVWRVVDSAKAIFDVESFSDFVAIQSETAIRSLAAIPTTFTTRNPSRCAAILMK